MGEESQLIYLPLQQTYTVGDKTIDIQIYRLPATGVPPEIDWTLICSSCGLPDGVRLSGFKG